MYKLVIGNKNYSSWSLRPWLLMKIANIVFEEINIELFKSDSKQTLLRYSKAGKVPVLVDSEMTIWDSLAIAEYLAEQHPEKALWPLANDSRAIARSVTNEMHSGFNAVRNTLPMNCRLNTRYEKITPELQKEFNRLCEIWKNCRQEYGEQGDFLFGKFSIADAFYAPIVIRLNGYGIKVGKIERRYMDSILALPALQEWFEEAKQEKTIIDAYEI